TLRPLPVPTLLPYTTLFRSPDDAGNIPRTIHAADRGTDVLAADVRLEAQAQLGNTRHNFAVGVDHQNADWEEYNYISSATGGGIDRKSTRLNSSHVKNSYAV